MSPLNIELDAETENRLKELSLRDGSAIEALASRLLAQAARSARPAREIAEARLLQEINEGWPTERWEKYHTLVAKRKAETLTDSEYAELAALTNDREIANAVRLQRLVDLAKLRHTSLDAVIDELGLCPPGYAEPASNRGSSSQPA